MSYEPRPSRMDRRGVPGMSPWTGEPLMSKDDVETAAVGGGARGCQCRECSGVPDGEYWTDQVCTRNARAGSEWIDNNAPSVEWNVDMNDHLDGDERVSVPIGELRSLLDYIRRTSPQGEAIEGVAVWRQNSDDWVFVRGAEMPLLHHPDDLRATLILHPQGEEE